MEVNCGFEHAPSGGDILVTYGPTLVVDIGFDPAYVTSGGTVPALAAPGILGLIDTGASESCIDSLLASQLQLPIVDRRNIAGAHGSHPVNMHLAQIHVPSLGLTIHGMFAAVDLAGGGQTHRALIGRTFLRHVTMTYDGKTGAVLIKK